jgi:hypothetical protein
MAMLHLFQFSGGGGGANAIFELRSKAAINNKLNYKRSVTRTAVLQCSNIELDKMKIEVWPLG